MLVRGFPSFLNQKDWEYAHNQTINGNKWAFSGASNTLKNRFWFLDLNQDPFFTDHFFEIIKQKTGNNYKLDRVYANGHTYGLSGEMHTDREQEDEGVFDTFLYYPCREWAPEWGGFTIVLNKERQLENLQPPIPNLGILFDSKLLHCGLEPTHNCNQLRVTVAFKMTRL